MRPYEELIVPIPDYPKPGIVFQDLTPAFADGVTFAAMVDDLAAHFADAGITKVVGAEARGFIVGAAVALRLGAGFVPCRKPGKLPRTTLRESYVLEYGTDALEIHADALTPDDVVLIWTIWWPRAAPPRPWCALCARAARIWRASASLWSWPS